MSLKIFMMRAETNKTLRDDSGYQWNYDGNGDHWNIAWWQWRSLKHCMTVEIIGILHDDSGDHWNIVWWEWWSLKYCMMTVEITGILYDDSGDNWNIAWRQWRSLKYCNDDSGDHLNAVIFYSLRHWNNVWWHWRSLKDCVLILGITEMLCIDSGRRWHAVWWVGKVIKYWLWFVPVLK